MTDEFETFLAAALAPPDRLPDRAFVARVQAVIAVDQQWAAARRSALSALAKQVGALAAVAADLWLIARAAPVARWAGESPGLGLAMLLIAFGLFIALVGNGPQWRPHLSSRIAH